MEGDYVKTNNISDALKLMLFGVSVLITCMLIKVFFITSDEANALSEAAIGQMQEMNNDIRDSGIMKYNDMELYGSDVVNCIKKYLSDYSTPEVSNLYVRVKTTKSENTYQNDEYIDNIKNFDDIKYIKPTASFCGEVVKDINDVIIGICFTQR